MKFSFLAAAAVALLAPSTVSTDAFAPKAFLPRSKAFSGSCEQATATTVSEVATTPIAGMKPGTSGLRKKVEIWQGLEEANKHYVENFIQSLLDTATESNGGKMLET
jgi:phosphoglucomutase